MREQKNTIIINGKTYDASTGDLLSAPNVTKPLVSDFISTPKLLHKPAKPKPKSRATHHISHHKPQKSQTLHRSVVRRAINKTISASLPIESHEVKIESGNKLDFSHKDRSERAKSITKSQSISKFRLTENKVSKQHLPIAVRPAPTDPPKFKQAVPPAHYTSHKSSSDIFTDAINKADSHRQAPHKLSKRKHRVAKRIGMSARMGNAMAIALVAIVLSGFIAYQNAAVISVRLAASRSGLASADLPGYNPSGFAVSKRIDSQPGEVKLNYYSNSDNRSFSITQSSSNWSSQTLADSFLSNKQAQRVEQNNGKTIYLYGDSSATWVDGGVWYRIEGNSSLTSDQLIRIANSF